MKKITKILTTLAVILTVACALVACKPVSVSSAKDKMISAGYSVTTKINLAEEDKIEGLKGGIYANKLNSSTGSMDKILALKFKSEKDAKAFFESEQWKKCEFPNGVSKVAGKWLYTATIDAERIFLG